MNAYAQLPRIILVIMDWDIVRYLNYFDYGVSKDLGKLIKHLVREIEKLIQICREDLATKKKGSVISTEPKVIYVKMLQRPQPSQFMLVRNKFNAILEETLSRYHYCYIMDIDKALSTIAFGQGNQLTNDGAVAFWHELNQQIGAFDRQDISLKPSPVVSQAHEAAANRHSNESTAHHCNNSHEYHRYFDSYFTRKKHNQFSSILPSMSHHENHRYGHLLTIVLFLL